MTRDLRPCDNLRLLGSLAAAACSSSTSPGAPSENAGSGGGTNTAGASASAGTSGGVGGSSAGGSGAGGSSAGGSGAGGSSAAGGAGPTSGGYIGITQVSFGTGSTAGDQYSAEAVFIPTVTPIALDPGCTRSQDGDCSLLICPPSGAGGAGGADGAGGSPPMTDAGVITITGGSKTVTLVPANGAYAVVSDNTLLFHGGETLTLSAVGNVVPAFTGILTAPDSPTLTAPALPPVLSSPLVIPRSQPLQFSWSMPANDTILVVINSGDSASTGTGRVACNFAGSKGSAAIPAADLQMLPAGAGNLGVQAFDMQMITAGSYGIGFEASSSMNDAKGRPASGTVTLQ